MRYLSIFKNKDKAKVVAKIDRHAELVSAS